MERLKGITPFAWVGSLSLSNGLSFVMITIVAETMYKRLGLSNSDIAFYTSWLLFPWVIKPIWKPLLEVFRQRHWCIVLLQFLIAVGLAGVAFSLKAHDYVRWTLAYFWLISFCCATHDAFSFDFFTAELDDYQQTLLVSIRRNLYRVSNIVGQGLTLLLAGMLEILYGQVTKAWYIAFMALSIVMLLLFLYHTIVFFLLKAGNGQNETTPSEKMKTSFNELSEFLKKKKVWILFVFLMLFHLPESFLYKINQLFMLESISRGGLGLTTAQVGFANGTMGIIGLICGGFLGGILVVRGGLKKWWWPMILSLTLPNIVYVYMSMASSMNYFLICLLIFLEQMGNGFGYMALLLYLYYAARGEKVISYYTVCTAFIALGMMLPGMFSGMIQESLGYVNFFILVMGCSLATFIAGAMVKVDASFGVNARKKILLSGDLSPLLSWCTFRKSSLNINNTSQI